MSSKEEILDEKAEKLTQESIKSLREAHANEFKQGLGFKLPIGAVLHEEIKSRFYKRMADLGWKVDMVTSDGQFRGYYAE